jgi:ribosome-associated heat shock protein Hsp15
MADPAQTMRLDRFLWFVRLAKKRTWAQDLAESGHLRIDGRRIEKAHAPVRIGNVVAFVGHDHQVRVIRVEGLPTRRGPPAEARACYAELDIGSASPTRHQPAPPPSVG